MNFSINRPAAILVLLAFACLFTALGCASESGPTRKASTNLLESLTDIEKNWLREHPVIRVGGPKSFPPFHYYDENNRARGIGPDYVSFILDELGIKTQYEPATPWPEVLDKIKTGKLDLIACAAKAPEREAFLDFSTPYLSFPMVIISRRDGSFIGGLQDLNGKKTAIIKKVPTASWLIRDGVKVIPHWVETPLEALKAVSDGDAEAVIENLAAASYMIQKNGLFDLKVAAPTSWGNYQLFFATRKDWPVLTSILNKALANMPQSQQSTIKNDWIGVRYQFGVAPKKIMIWAIAILVPLIVFVGFILFYNKRLRSEATARQAAEHEREKVITELRDALSNIKQLKGLLPICASCKKIRDDKGYWLQVEEYLQDHSEAEFSHSLCPDCIKTLYPDIADRVLTDKSDETE